MTAFFLKLKLCKGDSLEGICEMGKGAWEKNIIGLTSFQNTGFSTEFVSLVSQEADYMSVRHVSLDSVTLCPCWPSSFGHRCNFAGKTYSWCTTLMIWESSYLCSVQTYGIRGKTNEAVLHILVHTFFLSPFQHLKAQCVQFSSI